MIDHLYVHVPFCRSICSYCDFVHQLYRDDIGEKWFNRLKKETAVCFNEHYKTIYIGGGTPTALNADLFERLLILISAYINKNVEYEFTIEANPESLSDEKISLMTKYGVNRISIGLQTCNNELLKLMNRHHDFKDVCERVAALRANGLDNISLDIMYSLPFQTKEDLSLTLDRVLSLDVPHLSLYSLTIEENTVFYHRGYQPLDDDTEADMYELIEKRLEEAGYIHYEIANFCKPGWEARHNLGYWHYDDFRGLSLGACGKIADYRYDNTKKMSDYLQNENVIASLYPLSKEDLMFENIMMSLRLKEGISLELFKKRYGVDLLEYYHEAIEKHKSVLIVEDGYLKNTKMALLNEILLAFMK